MENRLLKTGIYKDFTGTHYRVLNTAKHTENSEELVLYRCLEGDEIGKLYATPVDVFLEEVDKIKYPEATQKHVFEWIEWGENSVI